MTHDFDIAFAITPLTPLYWYGAVYTVGFAGFFIWFWFRRAELGLSSADVFELSILISVGILIGGRAFDILVYEFDWYRANPSQILNWWGGGMASHGVLLGTLAGVIAFCRLRSVPVLVVLDEIVVPGAFLLAVGRLGNFIEGGVVGGVTSMPWGVVYGDLEGARHPVALYESVKNFVILPVLIWALLKWKAGSGIPISLFILLYAGLRFLVDTFRDYEAAWLGIGTGQVFNLVMAVSGLFLLIWFLRNPRGIPDRPTAKSRATGLLRPLVLSILILFPLGIPTSWTKDNIEQKRRAEVEEAS